MISVWAPRAARVDLELSNQWIELAPQARGWFKTEHRLVHGEEYRFRLDGGEALPDPRSGWQPEGPQGASRMVDHTRFKWTDGGWAGFELAPAVLYELHVGTFTPSGTFDGIVERLDDLVSLGVTAIELMPVAEFSGDRNWGYDGVDLYAPHHAYGGPDGLKRLVDACHARGLAVLMDVVYNHLGPVGNYLDRFGPYFTDRYSTPWGKAMNFDGPDSGPVRDFVIDNALMWLRDYHCDGLRLDAVHAIVDSSAMHILEELAVQVGSLAAHIGRPLHLVAESDLNDPRLVLPRELGGYGLDAQWNDDFHHALHAVMTGERTGYYADFGAIRDLATALTRAYVFEGRYSEFRRRHGRPATGVPGWRFIGYGQNHDQVGNRALGDRSGALLTPDQLKVSAAIVLTSPFTPMLFMGEEWGAGSPFPFFCDHRDPRVAQATREGRIHEFEAFGWSAEQVPDPLAIDTFSRARLDWGEALQERHANLRDWYRRLIGLRRSEPALHDGRLDLARATFDEAARWLLVERGPISVACNLAAHRQSVPLKAGGGSQVLASGPVDVGSAAVELPPWGVAILSRRPEVRAG